MFALVSQPVRQPRQVRPNYPIQPKPSPTPVPTQPSASQAKALLKAERNAYQPVLSGRYEVLIPNRGGKIYFTDSLADAAEKVASAADSSGTEARDILAFLEGVQKLGGLQPGDYGVRVHRTLDKAPWSAKVRGTQQREAPKFRVGQTVELMDPIGQRLGGEVTISDVVVLNDIRQGKQYGYLAGSGSGGYLLTEGRLRSINEVTGKLDFSQLPE